MEPGKQCNLQLSLSTNIALHKTGGCFTKKGTRLWDKVGFQFEYAFPLASQSQAWNRNFWDGNWKPFVAHFWYRQRQMPMDSLMLDNALVHAEKLMPRVITWVLKNAYANLMKIFLGIGLDLRPKKIWNFENSISIGRKTGWWTQHWWFGCNRLRLLTILSLQLILQQFSCDATIWKNKVWNICMFIISNKILNCTRSGFYESTWWVIIDD